MIAEFLDGDMMLRMKKKVSPKKDQYTVVLEDVRSHLKAIGEGQQITNRRLGSLEGSLVNVEKKLVLVESRLGAVEGRLGEVEERLGTVEERLEDVEDGLDQVKNVVMDSHEKRLAGVEKELKRG